MSARLAPGGPASPKLDAPRPSEGGPPPLAERLLALTLSAEGWRDSILGDLREEFCVIRQQHGEVPARRWYWRHALAIGSRRLTSRFGAGRRGNRSWVMPPDPQSAGWRAGFARDVQHAFRTLMRRPGTSAVVIVTLALALATNSTSFAILDALVLRPFRFPDLDRLVMVASSDPREGLFDRESVTAGDFRDWRREARTITHLSAAEWWDANLAGVEQPEQVAGFHVTADFFTVLGVRPILGRTFISEEEVQGNHRCAILGHALWTRLYAADPAIVGKTVRLDGAPYEVVGVAPPGFAIPFGAQVWAPLAYSPQEWADRRNRYLMTYGRLAEGRTIDDARAELGGIADRLRREYPETNRDIPNGVVTFTAGMADVATPAFVSTILAASGLLLLIACANIANLLLARGSERSQEFAMRLALGASRTRLAWMQLIEAGLLTTIAISLAVPLAWLGLALSRASIPVAVLRFVPGWQYMDISPAMFWSTAAFGAFATIVFAVVPALQTVRADVADTLRQGSRATTAPRQRHWLRNTLAAAQVAITLALLFGSGLMLTAADRAVNGSLGFDKDNLLVARVILPEGPYAEPERRRQFINGVLDKLRAIPAVSSASMVSHLPYGQSNASREFWIDGVTLQPGEVRRVDYRRVTPNYLETMRIPLLAGRALNDGDGRDTQAVAVISRSVADRHWKGDDPIGRQFRLTKEGPPITVVGVAGDVLHDWFQQQRAPTVYRPLAQDAPYAHGFVVRTVGDPMSMAGDLRRAVSASDPDQPVVGLNSMDGFIAERAAGLSFMAKALSVVAFIALVLAVMGLYSLMAFMVSRRTQELGVRMALGATRWQVIGLTTGHGLRITTVGLIIGAGAAVGLGRLMESMLFGVVASSVWQLAALATFVAAVSLLASYLPARKTARLDPTIALRAE